MAAIARLWERFLSLLAAIVGLLLLLAMVSVSADVVGRYFLAAPIGWVLELTEYILLYTPFLGMAWLVRRAEGHVRIDVLVSALPGRVQVKLNLLVALVAASACAAAAYYAGLTTWDHYQRGVETYGIYPIQKWTLLIVIAAGFAFTAVEFARKAQDHVRELRRDPGNGADPTAAA